MKNKLEKLGEENVGILSVQEEIKFSSWKYESKDVEKIFLEGSLNLLNNKEGLLEKASLCVREANGFGTSFHPEVYFRLNKFDNYFEGKSLNLQFPFKEKDIFNFIEGYSSKDLFLKWNTSKKGFSLNISGVGYVEYFNRNIKRDSILFVGQGGFDINPKENLVKLKSFYQLPK
ncbi:MAG: hypothetical protein PF542_00900 [Nanoarchaeota archaeon]|nr:hypothetical protein [Nanoarchaeota archaeon]